MQRLLSTRTPGPELSNSSLRISGCPLSPPPAPRDTGGAGRTRSEERGHPLRVPTGERRFPGRRFSGERLVPPPLPAGVSLPPTATSWGAERPTRRGGQLFELSPVRARGGASGSLDSSRFLQHPRVFHSVFHSRAWEESAWHFRHSAAQT